jgi:hypothetical protein
MARDQDRIVLGRNGWRESPQQYENASEVFWNFEKALPVQECRWNEGAQISIKETMRQICVSRSSNDI